jgi:hypothetical protein
MTDQPLMNVDIDNAHEPTIPISTATSSSASGLVDRMVLDPSEAEAVPMADKSITPNALNNDAPVNKDTMSDPSDQCIDEDELSELEDDLDMMDRTSALMSTRLTQAESLLQQGQAQLANLTTANTIAANSVDVAVMPVADEDECDGESMLPPALRLATLSMTPLQPYLMLFPSHQNDATYLDTAVPASERKTSFETALPHEQYGCPVLMNTPDYWLNAEEDVNDKEEVATVLAAVASRPSSLHRINEEADSEIEVLGSLPDFLLRSNSSSDPSLSGDIDNEVGAMRPGFVRCAKCKKWRTVPDDTDPNTYVT